MHRAIKNISTCGNPVDVPTTRNAGIPSEILGEDRLAFQKTNEQIGTPKGPSQDELQPARMPTRLSRSDACRS